MAVETGPRARPADDNAARWAPVGLKPLGEIYLAAGRRRRAACQ